MTKKYLFPGLFLILTAVFSAQSHAVKPFIVTCGDGEEIKVPDSGYNPADIASACFLAGHKPPKKSQASTHRKGKFGVKKNSLSYKTYTAKYLKTRVAAGSGNDPADVDHSDILLMLQGCTCISPSCVAYQCPADVDIP